MKSAYPELDRLRIHGRPRAILRKQWRRNARAAQGLNSRGQPRQLRRWTELCGLSSDEKRRRRNAVYNRRIIEANIAAGLTAWGKPRKDNPLPPRELAWRKLRAELRATSTSTSTQGQA